MRPQSKRLLDSKRNHETKYRKRKKYLRVKSDKELKPKYTRKSDKPTEISHTTQFENQQNT